MLGVGALGEVGATGAPPLAKGVQLSGSPPLDAGKAQNACTAPLGGDGDDTGDRRESKVSWMAAPALERLSEWASIEALQSGDRATVAGKYALLWIAEEARVLLARGPEDTGYFVAVQNASVWATLRIGPGACLGQGGPSRYMQKTGG